MLIPSRRILIALASLLLRPLVTHAQPSAATPEPFTARFERIRQTATPAQFYAFLYDLPKGGDIHHHLDGAGLPEDWFAIATDPARSGGNTFYTRVRLAHYDPAEAAPALRFRTIQQATFDALPAAQREDYRALAALSADERAAWQSSVRLDRPGEGREEFFENTWPRLGELLSDPHVLAELAVVNLARFGAEGVRYIEAQNDVFHQVDHAGQPMDPGQVARVFEERLARPDALATGVALRF